MPFKDVPMLARVDPTVWREVAWRKLHRQLLQFTSCIIFRNDDRNVNFVLSHYDGAPGSLLSNFRMACESYTQVVAPPAKKPKPLKVDERRGRTAIIKKFPDVVEVLKEFVGRHSAEAQKRRRNTVQHLASASDGSAEGFTIEGARHHLFEEVPNLYEHGMTGRTVHRLFKPPNKGRGAARGYHGLINAKVAPKSNNWRKQGPAVHYGRAAQKIVKELFALHGQPIFSGDDMNIIQLRWGVVLSAGIIKHVDFLRKD